MSDLASIASRSLCCVLAFSAALGCGAPSAPAEPATPALVAEEAADATPTAAPVGAPTPSGTLHDHADAARPKLAQRLRGALMRGPERVSSVQRSDGIQQLHVEGGWNSASVLVRGPDGQPQRSCLDNLEQLDRMLGAQP
jgi:hypothetical protein